MSFVLLLGGKTDGLPLNGPEGGVVHSGVVVAEGQFEKATDVARRRPRWALAAVTLNERGHSGLLRLRLGVSDRWNRRDSRVRALQRRSELRYAALHLGHPAVDENVNLSDLFLGAVGADGGQKDQDGGDES